MIGVGLDETTIHRHVLPLYQSGLHASGYDLFKQFLKQSGFLEASMAILGEGRVVWNLLIKSQASEPAPRQVHGKGAQSRRLRRSHTYNTVWILGQVVCLLGLAAGSEPKRPFEPQAP